MPPKTLIQDLLKKVFDADTGTVKVLEYDHEKIHEGESYTVAVLATDTISICFKVPDSDIKIHMVPSWAAESKAEFEIWEGRSWAAESGENATIFNRNRNSSKETILQQDESGSFVADMKVVTTPTLVGDGVMMHPEETWSNQRNTHVSRGQSEIILKNDETYVFLLTSNDGVKGTQIELNFYEAETD